MPRNSHPAVDRFSSGSRTCPEPDAPTHFACIPISDLCNEYRLKPTLFYAWQKLFFENGASAFERKSGSAEQSHLRTIAALREKLQRKNEVVAELMEEHIQL